MRTFKLNHMEESMPFTVEIDENTSEIVILDTEGNDKDVVVLIRDDDKVFIRQQCPESDRVDVIEMNWPMLVALAGSLECEPGLYHLEPKD